MLATAASMNTSLRSIVTTGASLLLCCLATLGRADVLYVANFNGNTIERFTANGVGSVFASSGLSNPYGLAFDSAGNLFVSNKRRIRGGE